MCLKAALATLAFLLLPLGAVASQDAVVRADNTAVRESPDPEAPVVTTLKAGTHVRISSQNDDGWYKIALPAAEADKKTGWVWQSNVFLDSGFPPKAIEMQPFEKSRKSHPSLSARDPMFAIRAGVMCVPFLEGQLSQTLGQSKWHLYYGSGYFGEAAWSFIDRGRVALRFGMFRNTDSVLWYGTKYTIETDSNPLLLGVNYDFWRRGPHCSICTGVSCRLPSLKGRSPPKAEGVHAPGLLK